MSRKGMGKDFSGMLALNRTEDTEQSLSVCLLASDLGTNERKAIV